MPRARWYDPWIVIYRAELGSLGLSVSDAAVIELLQAKVGHVADLMRVTEPTARVYLREEDIRVCRPNTHAGKA